MPNVNGPVEKARRVVCSVSNVHPLTLISLSGHQIDTEASGLRGARIAASAWCGGMFVQLVTTGGTVLDSWPPDGPLTVVASRDSWMCCKCGRKNECSRGVVGSGGALGTLLGQREWRHRNQWPGNPMSCQARHQCDRPTRGRGCKAIVKGPLKRRRRVARRVGNARPLTLILLSGRQIDTEASGLRQARILAADVCGGVAVDLVTTAGTRLHTWPPDGPLFVVASQGSWTCYKCGAKNKLPRGGVGSGA